MGVVAKEEAERIADPHMRAALLEGVDLNHFCGACCHVGYMGIVVGKHTHCTGDAAYLWDKEHKCLLPQACLCACPLAKARRGEAHGEVPIREFGPGLSAHAAWRTTTGLSRESNEDAVAALAGPGWLAVAVFDGMGGVQAGEVASALAAETVRERLSRATWSSTYAFKVWLAETIAEANRRVYDFAMKSPNGHKGMGTTLTLAVAWAGVLGIAHVGDSRCYLLRGGELRQLTDDHTMTAALAAAGKTPEEIADSGWDEHTLVQAVGPEREVAADVLIEPLRAGDVVVLTTDGVHGVVTIVANGTPAAVCRSVIDATYAAGAPDNATVIVMKVEGV